MKKIKNHIKNDPTIYSDSWRAYKTKELEKAGFESFKVNHKYNFVDPNTGINTDRFSNVCGDQQGGATRNTEMLHAIISSSTWFSLRRTNMLLVRMFLRLC